MAGDAAHTVTGNEVAVSIGINQSRSGSILYIDVRALNEDNGYFIKRHVGVFCNVIHISASVVNDGSAPSTITLGILTFAPAFYGEVHVSVVDSVVNGLVPDVVPRYGVDSVVQTNEYDRVSGLRNLSTVHILCIQRSKEVGPHAFEVVAPYPCSVLLVNVSHIPDVGVEGQGLHRHGNDHGGGVLRSGVAGLAITPNDIYLIKIEGAAVTAESNVLVSIGKRVSLFSSIFHRNACHLCALRSSVQLSRRRVGCVVSIDVQCTSVTRVRVKLHGDAYKCATASGCNYSRVAIIGTQLN